MIYAGNAQSVRLYDGLGIDGAEARRRRRSTKFRRAAASSSRSNGRAVVVFNLGGEFFALNNRCPHRGGSLCEGKLTGLVQSDEPGEYQYIRRGEIIRCPWHSWEFDIRTGQVVVRSRQACKTRHYARVGGEGRASWSKGPYMAETFPVSVENDTWWSRREPSVARIERSEIRESSRERIRYPVFAVVSRRRA